LPFKYTTCSATKRCALVGNSQQQLTDPTRGALIDGYDFVMRLNQAPTEVGLCTLNQFDP
jgi:hypothetical protein